MFVGYRFLHEIWVVFPVALNGLPGWPTGDQLGTIFSVIADHHYSFILLSVVAGTGGITAGDYREQMGPVVAAMGRLLAAAICLAAVTQVMNEKHA